MSAPICFISNTNDGGLVVCEEALEILDQITQPVVVVAVVGLYRTGKSYLMNRLAGKQRGFALGYTIESKTKGIWMWCMPHPLKKDHILVLLDTEGLGDVEKGDEKHDVWIFCMAVLLSSTLVYNSLGTIDNTALEKLHYVVELAEHIKMNSGPKRSEEIYNTSTEFMRVFPSFIWTVRDFTLKLEKDGKPITADEYLEIALKLNPGDSPNALRNKTRKSLREFFAVRKCFVFECPVSSKKIMNMESLTDADLESDFVEKAKAFCSYIYSNSKPKTMKGGLGVTGRNKSTKKSAASLHWPKDMWSLLLQCKLVGKAQEMCSSLTVEQSLDYDKVKAAVLRAYELVPEAYEQHFWPYQTSADQMFVEFA